MGIATPLLNDTMAWAGVSLGVPSHWEPARLDLHYLRADSIRGPALEITSVPLKKAVSSEAIMQSLAKAVGSKAALTAPTEEQDPFQQAVHNLLQASSTPVFSWTSTTGDARGVGFATPVPGADRLVIVQYFNDHPDFLDTATQSVQTLQVTTEDTPMKFQIYGIRGQVPAGFAPVSFSFRAGHFRLGFKRNRETLVLDRIGPAKVLLKETPLAEWSATFHKLPVSAFTGNPMETYFTSVSHPKGAGRTLARALRQFRCISGMTRLATINGMILSLRHTGPELVNTAVQDELETTWESFTVVS